MQKTIVITIASLLIICIMLLIIQLLLKKVKNKSAENGQIKNAYGLWFAILIVSASILSSKTMTILFEAIDTIYKTTKSDAMGQAFKTIALFIGTTGLWFAIWFFVVKTILVLIVGNRKEEMEMENNNISYFLIRGSVLLGFILCLLPVFEIVVRAFMPSVELPFYH